MTVAALMRATGEHQDDLGRGLRLSQAQISRKQSGRSMWSLADLDRLSEHYGVPVPDLLCGMDHAVNKLAPRRRAGLIGGTQTVIHAGGGAG
ncbi:helix-turn-helix domain-containing protein [Streptomyces sp. H10-C2]|uniref:helix-turn-helix domain-containing protein n=1 Tax=unclassified Streptomyces TaxID=2593676 RepID=UPI0024BBE696|nr:MULTISPECIES: helix-turn-helix domain-containing protein [unclassified Streptomyces]MDJ0347152.1 helix-turn-helix domain-containing protein [Streptomyces sp. PH10-H1]MDJ0375411.1 helix-turn-helix domain-containing protein [Streptomyces sp. H10-C2]